MKKKTGLLIILGSIIFMVGGITYAWFTWNSSANTSIAVTVGGATISYEAGPDIQATNLIPVSSKDKGIKKEITVSSTQTVYLDLYLDAITFPDGLKDYSFKYAVYRSDMLVNSGNFASVNQEDRISLLTDEVVGTTLSTYTLYIWIDGNMDNPNTMTGQNFQFTLKADATDKMPSSMETLTKLGITEIKKGTPNFEEITPNEITSYTDTNFNLYTSVVTPNVNYYITYADSYTFDSTTGLYTLVNPQVGQFSSVYGSLANKYIVNVNGSSSNTVVNASGLGTIYKVTATTSTTLTYISSTKITNYAKGNSGVYKTEDDYGTSYYYRGNVDNNYVKFGSYSSDVYYGYGSETTRGSYRQYSSLSECQSAADYNINCEVGIPSGTPMYWRIVRVNGDGSIRLIYDGTSAHANGENSIDRMTGRIAFNSTNNDNAYVGYMYGSTGANTYEETHTNTNNSTIKTYIDTWYSKYLSNVSSKLVDSIYCNDRSVYTGNSSYPGPGNALTKTYYGAYDRIYNSNTPTSPTLKCPQKNDAFTVSDTEKGNGALTYPVGLITADEVSFAGERGGTSNYGYYMYTGQAFRTMSPSYFSGSNATGFFVYTTGTLNIYYVTGAYGVRPAVSLSSDAVLTGTGTQSDPFVVELN